MSETKNISKDKNAELLQIVVTSKTDLDSSYEKLISLNSLSSEETKVFWNNWKAKKNSRIVDAAETAKRGDFLPVPEFVCRGIELLLTNEGVTL